MRSSGICVLEYNAFAPACEVSDEPRHDVGFLYLTSLYKLFVMVSKNVPAMINRPGGMVQHHTDS